MFRISDIVSKVVTTFDEAEAAIENAATAIYNRLPKAFQAMVQEDIVTAKQYVSNALSAADTTLAAHQAAIAKAAETAADTELALITGGKSVGLNGLTNAAIDELVASGVAAFHNWGLSVKADFAAQTPAVAGGAQNAIQPEVHQPG
jgi:hypothetical protein